MLHNYGTSVYLVSGGFRSFIEPLADYLEIPKENIYANRILFNEKGNQSLNCLLSCILEPITCKLQYYWGYNWKLKRLPFLICFNSYCYLWATSTMTSYINHDIVRQHGIQTSCTWEACTCVLYS